MNFAELLTRAMAETGMDAVEVADLAGVDERTVANSMTGVTVPDDKTMILIGEVVGLTPEDIFPERDGMTTGEHCMMHRRRAGLSRVKLAALAGISTPTLAGLETADNGVRLYALIGLADALGLSIDDYIGRTVPG